MNIYRYVIGQRIASTYQPHPKILLAGDACHTHSSGAAQGLNCGIHDSVNLSWKLVMVLKGLATKDVLETYESERRTAAQRLIEFDRQISALMSNKWPEGIPRPPGADTNEVLAGKFDSAKGLNTGLGIFYDTNLINVVSDPNSRILVRPGCRAPDGNLLKVGTLEPIRLQRATPNRGCFYIVVFTGEPRVTYPAIFTLSRFLCQPKSFKAVLPATAVELITVVAVGKGG